MDLIHSGRFFAVSVALFWLTGCSATGTATPQPASPLNLTVYSTETSVVIPTLTVPVIESRVSVPTATPFTYTISKGDTLIGIALRYNVSLDDLLRANPGIQPEALSVGQTVQVPSSFSSQTASASPTPAPASLGPVACFPSGGGMYCLVPVQNPTDALLENVSVQITLLDASGQVTASQVALLPLDILLPGEALPAAAFFPGIQSSAAQQAQLLTAVPLSSSLDRYLSAQVKNPLVSIDWGGLSATVQGQVTLPEGSKPATRIWLAGVAYDAQENIVGFRRWEWAGSLAPGGAQPFAFSLYSVGPVIDKVDIIFEARP